MHIRRLAALTVLGACLVAGLLPTAVLAGGPTSGHVAGVVTDALTGDPVADVDVLAMNGAFQTVASTTTDADGEFLFVSLTTDSYDFRFDKSPDYLFTDVPLTISAGGIDLIEAVLVPREGAALPATVQIVTGEDAGGGSAALDADDNKYMKVASRPKNDKQVVRWIATFQNISQGLQLLDLTYRGRNSSSCVQKLEIFHWDESRWELLDQRTVGDAEKKVVASVGGDRTVYVEGDERVGAVRVRFTCTRGQRFVSKSDFMKFDYKAGAIS